MRCNDVHEDLRDQGRRRIRFLVFISFKLTIPKDVKVALFLALWYIFVALGHFFVTLARRVASTKARSTKM